MRLSASIAFLLACLAVGPVSAMTYFVDPQGGSDANNGLSPTPQGGSVGPWKDIPGTLAAPIVPATSPPTFISAPGWVKLNPGDTIVVKGGTISTVSVYVDSTWYTSGTPGSPVTILSGHLTGYGSGRAVIDGGTDTNGVGQWADGFFINGISCVRIQGFEIRNMAACYPNSSDSCNPGTSGLSLAAGSGGVYITGNTVTSCQVIGNLIHEIYGTPAPPSGYGVEVTGGTVAADMLIEGNVIYHTEEKAIELYRQGYSTIRDNYVYQNNDHGIVISSPFNTVYDNIISQAGYPWMTYEQPPRPAFGLKFDGDVGVVAADNNLAYNNLVLDNSSGIGILNANNNRIYFNTVYHSGFVGNELDGGFEGAAFAIKDDDGTGINSGNDVRDNIFYYSNSINGNAVTFAFSATIASSNVVSDNVISCDAAHTTSLVYLQDAAGASHWYSVDWLQGPSGFSAYGSGNIATNNVVADPGFSGGVGAALAGLMPTGFDASGHPNSTAFSLSPATPPSVLRGELMQAPLNVDIVGRVRTLFSLGAYEQTAVGIQGPPAPTGLRIKR